MSAKRRLLTLAAATVPLLAGRHLVAQSPAPPSSREQGAAELYRLVQGITVTPRVLVIGMHPDDEDTQLMTWLSRGRNVQTAYLSITRGEAGSNFGGSESGYSLGAIRTQEVLAARRIDGAQQFYTRAYDFGAARNVDDVLKHWKRDSIVGDIVAVIRAFRPHVIVAMLRDSTVQSDGQHRSLELFVEHAFISSADPRRFPVQEFGMPWPVPKLYRYGAGLQIETTGYDRAVGKTFSEIALESRAQHRSQGLFTVTQPQSTVVELRRIFSRIGDSSAVDASLFGAIDTTFARLALGALPSVASTIPAIAAYTDSARRALDLSNPSRAVPYLAEAARLASSARAMSLWCKHPSANAAPTSVGPEPCDRAALDLDASLDLVRERSVAALLAAAGISFEATADRDLIASNDTADVTVSMFNHGSSAATLLDVTVWASLPTVTKPVHVPPDSVEHVATRVTGLVDPHPWWAGPRGGEKRGGDRFTAVASSVDGVLRSGMLYGPHSILGVAVPENIRRTSDASVTVNVAGVTVSTSIGPIIYRYADAHVGLQNRAVAGIPSATIQFPRGLEWIPRNKPVTRSIRVAVKSHSDREQRFGLEIKTPKGMPKGLRVDSLPQFLQMDAHEQRELFVQLRGTLVDTARLPLALVGHPMRGPAQPSTGRGGPTEFRAMAQGRDGDDETYQTGFQPVQREYLPPIRLMPTSGEWIQPIDINVPPKLVTLYVPGGVDDLGASLRQVGAWVTEVETTDQLLTVDLSKVTTIAIGPRAFEAKPELFGQIGRLVEFVRQGGTLVVMRGDNALVTSKLFPFPLSLAQPRPENVVQFDSPITLLDANSRLLNWPNKIGPADWTDWVVGRAQSLPTTVDSRYSTVIETHDPEEKENRNSILVGKVGKGTIVYTTLTLEQQIAGGVPGALRLLMNMLSIGLAPAK